jgi:putative RNA 2'-phosphotransferase
MAKQKNISVYLSFLLRHKPEEIHLHMDHHGWVSVDELITGINKRGKYTLDLPQLEEIVRQDSKGRYRFNADHSRIKACQGHSIPWVQPEMEQMTPPRFLYHGTTMTATEQIMQSGAIRKMNRHAVHMQADPEKAWQSAVRWHLEPVVLKIDAARMSEDGFVFGKTENDVWCTDSVPVAYITELLTDVKS